ncbi:MAG TPA: GNAT family N-acetyltransferase [Caulobacteraceae bacterium]|jgi:ribosomal protein S18 acetylase RimI-like enzyme|nr:GNAT family N-acetyltransferase [Caulobacteraceae bacterium]
MSDHIQRLRRDLADGVADPVWPPGFSVRAFAPDDAAAVHRLMRIAYARGGGGVGAFEDWWPGLRDDAEFDPDLCFLAVDGSGRIVGAAQCWTSAFIKDLVVHPDARQRGLGEALLLTAFAAFRRRGAAQVDLKVELDNPTGAVRLYRRLGMVDVAIDG